MIDHVLLAARGGPPKLFLAPLIAVLSLTAQGDGNLSGDQIALLSILVFHLDGIGNPFLGFPDVGLEHHIHFAPIARTGLLVVVGIDLDLLGFTPGSHPDQNNCL